jgi:hypothetical protein
MKLGNLLFVVGMLAFSSAWAAKYDVTAPTALVAFSESQEVLKAVEAKEAQGYYVIAAPGAAMVTIANGDEGPIAQYLVSMPMNKAGSGPMPHSTLIVAKIRLDRRGATVTLLDAPKLAEAIQSLQ